MPIVQTLKKVDLRIKTSEVPRQEVMTKDNIPMLVNAVVYFKVLDPAAAIIKIEDYQFAIRQYTQAALRDVIGNNEMDAVLMERVAIAESIKEIVDKETVDWGIDIESIKIQELELPAEMKRAMAKQAEAERERRAAIISSQGELSAAENLRDAAQKLAETPAPAPAHPANHRDVPGPLGEIGPVFAQRPGQPGQEADRRTVGNGHGRKSWREKLAEYNRQQETQQAEQWAALAARLSKRKPAQAEPWLSRPRAGRRPA